DSNSWVACDSRCEESKIINGRMIQYDSKFEVPPDVDPKSIGEKIDIFSVKRNEETMENWDLETLGKVVESKEKKYNQNKPTDIKTTTPMTTDSFMGWKKKKMDEKGVVRDSQRAKRAKNDRMSGRELFLADASLFVDDAEAYDKCHREEKPDNSNQESQKSLSVSRPSTSTSVAAVYEEENSDINDVKLYHLRRWIKDLGKETKGFTHVWKFDTWKWPKRKKERRKESYVKLMFWYEDLYKEFGLEYCRKWAVVLLFMFDAVVDGSSKIRRGNELKTKFAREGFKYEMGDWVYLKLQTYMQLLEIAKNAMCVLVSKLRKWKCHITRMGDLTVCEDDELSAVEPQMILARRKHKWDNKVDVYVLVQCVKDNVVADATLV
ncbi:zinc finger CCCH domain-containing protein 11-like protein, partial [Tanacetum coccineum]